MVCEAQARHIRDADKLYKRRRQDIYNDMHPFSEHISLLFNHAYTTNSDRMEHKPFKR